MGRLLLGERLDTDLIDVGTDKRNPNGITRCLSMTVNKDQHQENRTKIKVISIMSGDRLYWQWVKQSAREIVISDYGEGRVKRSRSLTSNGLTYKKEMFKERKVSSRLIWKYSIIEGLLFSVKNIILVEEEIKQLNELFNMLLDELFFCGMADRRKGFSLIFSRDHCQRFSPSRTSDTPRTGFEPAQNLSSGLVKWSCAVVITTTPRHTSWVQSVVGRWWKR